MTCTVVRETSIHDWTIGLRFETIEREFWNACKSIYSAMRGQALDIKLTQRQDIMCYNIVDRTIGIGLALNTYKLQRDIVEIVSYAFMHEYTHHAIYEAMMEGKNGAIITKALDNVDDGSPLYTNWEADAHHTFRKEKKIIEVLDPNSPSWNFVQ